MVASAPDVRFWAERGGLLLKRARQEASLNQTALADASGTSRTTLSAYEHGRKSPTLETAGRILDAAGFQLAFEPKIAFTRHAGADGRAFYVPDRLPRLPPGRALTRVHPGFARGRVFDLADRGQRREAYSGVLCLGSPDDLLSYVDGVLLLDLWGELALPGPVREAWRPVTAQL
ncbi:helix-turn-helix domain-containing protein [Nonomuraea sp. NBC_01738]|uniref:helix-turn-helix transcriptional regulator n=1 Tax=Nonomuraea sp. NBC_01738 TaxID=2976003 RepID=UPI002E105E2F|nr:helix-turn-helix domain-containing protein [Nonomuraea sp. NBC_01738]